MTAQTACELCGQPGGDIVMQHEKLRVVLIDDPQYPGFCRVIWHAHVKEMTDLPPSDRALFMAAVWQVETAVREVMQPDKMNVASLGNMTPHMHWHVIPRYATDAHFPGPVWAQVQRTASADDLTACKALLPALRQSIIRHMGEVL